MAPERCRICGGQSLPLFAGTVLSGHEAHYVLCQVCRYVQVADPYWVQEAHSAPIASTDTGLLQRNQCLVKPVSAFIRSFSSSSGTFVDMAGGYGVFVRLMRDEGFDFRWHDVYAPNLFAQGFEFDVRSGPFVVATAFEVLEHLIDPAAFVRETFALTGCDHLVTTTELYRGSEPDPDWWYLAPETGQHIGFFSRGSLDALAEKCDVHLQSNGYLHVFSRRAISPLIYRLVVGRLSRVISWTTRRALPGLAEADRLVLIERARRSSVSNPLSSNAPGNDADQGEE